jgi:hypothetical protein
LQRRFPTVQFLYRSHRRPRVIAANRKIGLAYGMEKKKQLNDFLGKKRAGNI